MRSSHVSPSRFSLAPARHAEAVFRRRAEDVARTQNRVGEVRLVDGIGIVLRFEGEAREREERARELVLQRIRERAAGVDLHARLGRPRFEDAPGDGILHDRRAREGAVLRGEREVVVVLSRHPRADRVRHGEVEVRPRDGQHLARGDLPGAERRVAGRGEREEMVRDGGAAVAAQVEVDVVRKVDGRRPVRRRLPVDAPGVRARERVRHLHVERPGKAALAVGAAERQHEAVRAVRRRTGRRVPDLVVEARRAAVQQAREAVGTDVRGQFVRPPVQREAPAGDAVRVASDERAAEARLREVERHGHVLAAPRAVRHGEPPHLPAVVQHLQLGAVRAFERIGRDRAAVLRLPVFRNLHVYTFQFVAMDSPGFIQQL